VANLKTCLLQCRKYMAGALRNLLVALVCLAAVKVGLPLVAIHADVTAVWPLSGIALAAVLLCGHGILPGIALGTLTAYATSSIPLFAAIVLAAASTIEALLGALLLQRVLGFEPGLTRLKDIIGLFVVAAGGGAFMATAVSALSIWTEMSLPSAQLGPLWAKCWAGDALSVVIIAPVILAWARPLKETWSRQLVSEALLVLCMLVLAAVLIGVKPAAARAQLVLASLAVAAMVWIGLRLRQREAATAVFIISVLALWGTSRGLGPFTSEVGHWHFVRLNVFLGLLAFTTLALCAVSTARAQAAQATHEQLRANLAARVAAEAALRQREERYRSVLTATCDIVWTAMPDGAMVKDIPGWEELTGQRPDESEGQGWLAVVHPDDRSQVVEVWRRSIKRKTLIETECRLRHHNGGYRYTLVRGVPVFHASGEVREWAGTFSDINENRKAKEDLVSLANYDALTQLPNRTLFMDRLEKELTRGRRHQQEIALLFLDLDGFKEVNDSSGHGTGDQLLQAVAERLARSVRNSDTVARFGGDEFVVMLTDFAQSSDVDRIAQVIVETLSKAYELNGREFSITTSVGISLYPRDGEDAESLLKCADTAMYLAKRVGNRYQHYSPALGEKASRRMTLKRQLRRALAQDQFELHYQPEIDLASGRIETVEALLRWRRASAGKLVRAAEFIALADECGLARPIGDWVRRAACTQMHEWRAQGAGSMRLAINISAREFRTRDMKKVISRVLKQAELDPSCLELDLPEDLLQSEGLEHVLSALERTGIRLAIDDFGAGFSSLSYLKRLPVHKLKLDRSITTGLPDHADNAAICTAIAAMAHSLNLRITLKGVETPAQLAFLRTLHCHAAQGYLLGRPLPPDELGKLLTHKSLPVRRYA
jgi:diguanylate cyclase (GGDEF)-like protein/PAS domain S-box-containing protein